MKAMRVPELGTQTIQSVVTSIRETMEAPNKPANLLEWLALLTTGYLPDPEQEKDENSYYDYPSLKPAVWHWEIVWYFYFGGLAAGCYLLATLASVFGSDEDKKALRLGYYLSMLAFLPCPPLLIKDLGRPERFLNMMRIVKVKSPMSMGSWSLAAFGTFAGATLVSQGARDGLLGKWWGARLIARFPQKLITIPGSFAALFLGGYTGVLLAATSNPLWSRSRMMTAMFFPSAMSTSTALMSTILRFIRTPASVLHKLEKLEWINMIVELISMLTFLRQSGRAARPLVGTGPKELGPTFWRFMFGGGLVLPWFLQTFMLSRHKKHEQKAAKAKKNNKQSGKSKHFEPMSLFVSLLVLVGGYFLRKTIVYAGHESSKDARTTFWNARR
ncbi:MAG TPA: NrfD/PsrC family molybdoenzyme membrane anchor subunit [Dictyobacter sp.]|jgi:formate-dependent nitrite reductase membrane component NrfD|nr:NrfD/PsrC family molybdoenzyme membrane anchor subunit [Dictyobacter sp.]